MGMWYDWATLGVALCAFFAAGLAHREAARSSNRKLVGRVNEALDELEVSHKKLKRDWEEERDRLIKQARRTGASLRRLDQILDESKEGAEGEEGDDVGGDDVEGGPPSEVPAVRPYVGQIPWRGGRTG